MPAEYSNTVLSVIIRTFLIWSGEKGKRIAIGKFNLLAFSLLSRSNENAAVIFFVAREFSEKKEAGYGHTFQFRLNVFVQGFGKECFRQLKQVKGRIKSCACVGSCLDKGICLTVIVLGDVGRESEANLHYYQNIT